MEAMTSDRNETPVTPEMVLAVHRAECRGRGHSWRVIEAYGEGPVKVLCDHCGEDSGLVQAKQVTRNVG